MSYEFLLSCLGAPWTYLPSGPVTLLANDFPFFESISSVYSTGSPSARERKPSAWIDVWWTNTSEEPSSGLIKPKPLTTSKNFTVPVNLENDAVNLINK